MHRLATPGAEPAAHLLARELLESHQAPRDLRLLVRHLLERALEPTVADELPAGLDRRLGERGIDIGALRADERRRSDPTPAHQVEQPRHAAAQSVLHP